MPAAKAEKSWEPQYKFKKVNDNFEWHFQNIRSLKKQRVEAYFKRHLYVGYIFASKYREFRPFLRPSAWISSACFAQSSPSQKMNCLLHRPPWQPAAWALLNKVYWKQLLTYNVLILCTHVAFVRFAMFVTNAPLALLLLAEGASTVQLTQFPALFLHNFHWFFSLLSSSTALQVRFQVDLMYQHFHSKIK